MPPFRLAEISKYTSVGVSGLFNPCGGVMNKESYAALTPSQKAILDKHTGKAMSLKAAKIFDDWSDESFKMASDSKKVEVIQLPTTVRKAMLDAAQPVMQKTLADLEKDGIKDARAVYDAINK
jgi:TRAP-type C4-dicarboxylate transport system substrate-binding protein